MNNDCGLKKEVGDKLYYNVKLVVKEMELK